MTEITFALIALFCLMFFVGYLAANYYEKYVEVNFDLHTSRLMARYARKKIEKAKGKTADDDIAIRQAYYSLLADDHEGEKIEGEKIKDN